MQIWVAGTDTNIGKTIISSWLCLQTGSAYFKPIQTGTLEDRDAARVHVLSGVKIHPEIFSYKAPLSPHVAAALENEEIDIKKIALPPEKKLIVEGAGGLLVPINKKYLMVDLMKQLNIPIMLVASSRLGTINHTLLSLEALNHRKLEVLGVIMNGPINEDNRKSIEFYGNTTVIAQMPYLDKMDRNSLKKIPLSQKLENILMIGKR